MRRSLQSKRLCPINWPPSGASHIHFPTKERFTICTCTTVGIWVCVLATLRSLVSDLNQVKKKVKVLGSGTKMVPCTVKTAKHEQDRQTDKMHWPCKRTQQQERTLLVPGYWAKCFFFVDLFGLFSSTGDLGRQWPYTVIHRLTDRSTNNFVWFRWRCNRLLFDTSVHNKLSALFCSLQQEAASNADEV